jgi:hypothetical protein
MDAPENMPSEMDAGLRRGVADEIVADASAVYFDGCRERVDGFIDANFSFLGSAKLHRHAVGWDLLKAPANVALSVPQIGLKLAAGTARALGRRETAAALAARNLFFDTAVARELRWRIMTELLRLPVAEDGRESRVDGLAEAILADPRVQALLVEAGEAAAARQDDPAFRARLEAALTEYAGTRSAAAEITTALITLGTGAAAFKTATPGAIALGPVLAGTLAQSAAVSSFPLGASAGGLWYGLFPVQASPFLVAGATAGVLGVAALATAFAGILSDPVQRALGLHRRRLLALIAGLEAAFRQSDERGFVAYDLYVARLLDLGDILLGITRNLRA